jgi:hypothetical protein
VFHRLVGLLNLAERGAIARRLHSRWLTRAVEARRVYPKIPVRPVDQGGFSGLTSTAEGRLMCDGWWYQALGQVEDAD